MTGCLCRAAISYCPHLPDAGCDCRKPATGLLSNIEQQLGRSASNAYFIGDSLKDLQAARAYGCRPVLVKSGKGEQTLATLLSPDPGVSQAGSIPVYENLKAASEAILEATGR
jgi:D-glycero-D-manno-heptose 1,7-bisphosphate phosphatase